MWCTMGLQIFDLAWVTKPLSMPLIISMNYRIRLKIFKNSISTILSNLLKHTLISTPKSEESLLLQLFHCSRRDPEEHHANKASTDVDSLCVSLKELKREWLYTLINERFLPSLHIIPCITYHIHSYQL